jgi:hypothetical protein
VGGIFSFDHSFVQWLCVIVNSCYSVEGLPVFGAIRVSMFTASESAVLVRILRRFFGLDIAICILS